MRTLVVVTGALCLMLVPADVLAGQEGPRTSTDRVAPSAKECASPLLEHQGRIFRMMARVIRVMADDVRRGGSGVAREPSPGSRAAQLVTALEGLADALDVVAGERCALPCTLEGSCRQPPPGSHSHVVAATSLS